MNADEMRNVAAESVGICRRLSDEEFKKAMKEWESEDEHPHASLTRPSRVEWKKPCPKYDTDLNAISELISNMSPVYANAWADELTKITSFAANPNWTHWFHLANASAIQKLEAYLRANGLYK